jgi:hypothetical protein
LCVAVDEPAVPAPVLSGRLETGQDRHQPGRRVLADDPRGPELVDQGPVLAQEIVFLEPVVRVVAHRHVTVQDGEVAP